MAADGGVHLGEALGLGQGDAARVAVHPDRHELLDSGRERVGHELGVVGLADLEVRVRVDHCCLGKSGSSFSIRAPPGQAPSRACSQEVSSGWPSAPSALTVLLGR